MVKILHYSLAVLFLLFAAVQYNDPDPLLWVLIYGAVFLIAVVKLQFRQVNFKPLITTFIVIFLLFAFTYIPSFLEFLNQPDKVDLIRKMKAEKPWIEETRELGGLLIAVAALIYMRQKPVQE